MRALDQLLLGCCACAALGCGTAPQTPPIPDVDAGVSIVVAPAYDSSPVFVRALVIPQQISPGGSAAIAVEARDALGSDSGIVYRWSAAAGSFSQPNEAVTAYQCEAVGEQVLSVTAEDSRGGHSELALPVNCAAQ